MLTLLSFPYSFNSRSIHFFPTGKGRWLYFLHLFNLTERYSTALFPRVYGNLVPDILLLSVIYLSIQSGWREQRDLTVTVSPDWNISLSFRLCVCVCVACVCAPCVKHAAEGKSARTRRVCGGSVFGRLFRGLCFVRRVVLHQSLWSVHMSPVPAVIRRVTASLLVRR